MHSRLKTKPQIFASVCPDFFFFFVLKNNLFILTTDTVKVKKMDCPSAYGSFKHQSLFYQLSCQNHGQQQWYQLRKMFVLMRKKHQNVRKLNPGCKKPQNTHDRQKGLLGKHVTSKTFFSMQCVNMNLVKNTEFNYKYHRFLNRNTCLTNS